MAEDTIKPTAGGTAATKTKPVAPAKVGATAAAPEVQPDQDIGATPHGDDAAGGTGSTAKAGNVLKEGATKLAKEATGKAKDYIAEGKNRAGDALDEVSRLMGDAANTVDERLGPQYGQYARSAADGISGFAENLKGKEIDDLLADAQQLVRKSPAVAIGVAAALGFVLARLVKAGLEPAASEGGQEMGDPSGATSGSGPAGSPPSTVDL